MVAWIYTVKLGRRRWGPFAELRRALEVLRAERSSPFEGQVVVEAVS